MSIRHIKYAEADDDNIGVDLEDPVKDSVGNACSENLATERATEENSKEQDENQETAYQDMIVLPVDPPYKNVLTNDTGVIVVSIPLSRCQRVLYSQE